MNTPPDVRVLARGAMFELGQPSRFGHVRITLPLPGHAVEPIRFLHLSDLHLIRPWSFGLDELNRIVGELSPQLILFTGDWIHGRIEHGATRDNLLRICRHWASTCPVFAVRGNHDKHLPMALMRDTGVQMIEGESRQISIGKRTIELVGLVGRSRRRVTPRFLSRFPPRTDTQQTARIVLTHFPDTIEKIGSLAPDLVLAGHTHGGQICLPGAIPLIRHDSLPRRFCHGLNQHANGYIHVTSGLGCSGIWVRAFRPAEIAEFVV